MGITYCSRTNCDNHYCTLHQSRAPSDRNISITDRNIGCFFEKERINVNVNRKKLLQAICDGTQKTNYKCNDACKALCSVSGDCAYCSIMADKIEEALRNHS